jgi:hypothetical protein
MCTHPHTHTHTHTHAHRYYCLARLGTPTAHWHSEEPDQVQLCLPCLARLDRLPNPPIMPLHGIVDEASRDKCDEHHADTSADCAAHNQRDGVNLDSQRPPAKQDTSEHDGHHASKMTEQRAYVDLIQKRAAYYEHCNPITDYLEHLSPELMARFLVKDSDLQKWKSYVFDVVTSDSRRCSCFTKSYGKYVRGTGSVLASTFYDESGRCCSHVSTTRQIICPYKQKVDYFLFVAQSCVRFHAF